jgi:hypothetical protein
MGILLLAFLVRREIRPALHADDLDQVSDRHVDVDPTAATIVVVRSTAHASSRPGRHSQVRGAL